MTGPLPARVPARRSPGTRLAALLAAAAAALAGCIDLRPGPLVSVEGLRISKVGPDATEADLLVSVQSRIAETAPLDDFRYSFAIEGRTVFRGRWSALSAVPPDESISRTLPVVIPTDLLPPADPQRPDAERPLRWSVSGSLGWEDPQRLSRILLDLGLPNPRSDFSGRGENIGPAIPPS